MVIRIGTRETRFIPLEPYFCCFKLFRLKGCRHKTHVFSQSIFYPDCTRRLTLLNPCAGTEDSTSQYFPLAVGSRCVYESTEYTDDKVTDESWEVLREEEDSLALRFVPGSLGGGRL